METRLAATMCTLPGRGRGERPLDIWSDIAGTLCSGRSADYHDMGRRYRLLLPDSKARSPDGKLQRFRTVNVHPRIKKGCPTLLDLEVDNWFCRADNPTCPVRVADIPDAGWARRESTIPLAECLALTRKVVRDLKQAGWVVKQAELKPLALEYPTIAVNGQTRRFTPGQTSKLVRQALRYWPVSDFGVVGLGESDLQRAAKALSDAWAGLTAGSGPSPNVHRQTAPEAGGEIVSLVVIPNDVDLWERPDLLTKLVEWEAEGCRFKLARSTTLSKRFPLETGCYDLALISGFSPWIPELPVVPATGFDAGHDTGTQRSRWAAATANSRLQIESVATTDTPLAEHMPDRVLERFWPDGADSMILRDGRLARERKEMMQRTTAESRPLVEVKKRPGTYLFRKRDKQDGGAQFADAVTDSHGEVLLQTLSNGRGNYHQPLRISLLSVADRLPALQGLLAQTAVPTLALFHGTRLPGVIYWADRASKLDRTGWSQVIGRGWHLPGLVPLSRR